LANEFQSNCWAAIGVFAPIQWRKEKKRAALCNVLNVVNERIVGPAA
jgi:hypothetical protein